MSDRLIALFVAAFTVAGSILALGAAVHADEAPTAPGPSERVVYAPEMGPPSSGPLAAAFQVEDSRALTVQNVGERSTRLLATYVRSGVEDEPGPLPCEDCAVVAMVCSEEAVASGGTWAIAHSGEFVINNESARAPGTVAAVYSLNTRPAQDYGDDWVAWLRDNEYAPDATLDQIVCDRAAELQADPPDDYRSETCGFYRSFEMAFLADARFALTPDLPFSPYRGEPIAGVAAVGHESSGGLVALDRYRALPLEEIGLPPDATPGFTYTYYAPGAHLATPDGLASTLIVRNLGLACVNVTVDIHQTGSGPELATHSFELSPWQKRQTPLAEVWPIGSTGAARIVSDGPVAVVLSTVGEATSMMLPALKSRASSVEWALPIAYQDGRTRSMASSKARPAAQGGTVTWASALAVLNPSGDVNQLTIEAQSADRSPRTIGVPVGAREQAVIPFRVGSTAPRDGFGWGRLSTEDAPMYAAIESKRLIEGSAPLADGWAATLWPRSPGEAVAQVIALPDLGLGRVADANTQGQTLTSTVEARVALQNLSGGTAEVAIDTYAGCGYSGSVTKSIRAGDSMLIPVEELSESVHQSNSAMIRVLTGEVAVLAEIAGADDAGSGNARVDLSNAYLGTPILGRPSGPAAPTATLEVDPAALTVYLYGPAPRPIKVHSGAGSQRCMVYRAASDEPWLSAVPATGPVPGWFELKIDRSKIDIEDRLEATITVSVDDPGVSGSPRQVHVTVLAEGVQSTIYLPYAANRGVWHVP